MSCRLTAALGISMPDSDLARGATSACSRAEAVQKGTANLDIVGAEAPAVLHVAPGGRLQLAMPWAGTLDLAGRRSDDNTLAGARADQSRRAKLGVRVLDGPGSEPEVRG